ncbi:hypothetical protein BCR35DRAFT_302230 [Leucosporidium creatinivorum]|uniref:tRNA-dihydrouridine(47) synthase [NAD(P)(+)] n=1 Tax=Leucosporidium creatinivorum TaxID=106004 RepID=A0A1Y2FVY0_9BASI|nr:hypothetical protein BCR35DRAFT_302230 [Leucosporidium creatinivorum]
MDSQPQPAPAMQEESKQPYWEQRPGTAPIRSEFVLWEKMGKNSQPKENDDDAAEGRSDSRNAQQEQATNVDSPAPVDGAATPASESTEEQPAEKRVRLSGAQKKALARAKKEEEWQAKQAAKAAAKAAGGDTAAGEGDDGAGGRKKGKGQNKGRSFHHQAGVEDIKLCTNISKGKECDRGDACRYSHDVSAYLAARLADIQFSLPTNPDDLTPALTDHICPAFANLGYCAFGFKCRFGLSHMRKVEDGAGLAGSGWELIVDEDKIAQRKKEHGEEAFKMLSDKGEFNFISMETIKDIRKGESPLAAAYLASIGEAVDTRTDGGSGKGKNKRGRDGKPNNRNLEDAAAAKAKADAEAAAAAAAAAPQEPSTSTPSVDASTTTAPAEAPMDVDSHPSRSFVPDLAPVRATEKRRLDWRGKLYLAPLTTVGNEPFRRLCGDYGNDISCSEMGLAQEFMNGNSNEWSLVRRHPSEKTFGVQLCGSRPQALVPAAEQIVKHCDIDFLDINCGCPIDLVFNKGAGSALLQHATKLGKSLVGMSQVLGEIPLTIKIRNGVQHNSPVAHKLIPKFQKEWGLSAMTLHGRSRQQRYKTKADYAYIAQCAKVLRETAADEGLAPIPIFGNGDAYDFRTYYENMEATGVDGIMIARGALIKPWLFTEIKEKRDWDISSRERLDMVGKLVDYGLEHWGSDQVGVNHVRRFVCESLSFTHRYIPVGLLERFPVQLNERAFPYRGRDELETLLASDQAADWVKITEMFLGPAPDNWGFQAKHKSSAVADTEVQG